jgi:hypothetical protein
VDGVDGENAVIGGSMDRNEDATMIINVVTMAAVMIDQNSIHTRQKKKILYPTKVILK